jgi:hypothetical protein
LNHKEWIGSIVELSYMVGFLGFLEALNVVEIPVRRDFRFPA